MSNGLIAVLSMGAPKAVPTIHIWLRSWHALSAKACCVHTRFGKRLQQPCAAEERRSMVQSRQERTTVMTKFNVTYELFNEDRDNEDAYDRGFISEDSILRDAIDDVTNVYSIECVE